MNISSMVSKLVSFGQARDLNELPGWGILLLGTVAILLAAYFGYQILDTLPGFVRRLNQLAVLNMGFLKLTLTLGGYVVATWIFAAIAVRCQGILYGSWIK